MVRAGNSVRPTLVGRFRAAPRACARQSRSVPRAPRMLRLPGGLKDSCLYSLTVAEVASYTMRGDFAGRSMKWRNLAERGPRWLGGRDSNPDSRVQSPLSYR